MNAVPSAQRLGALFLALSGALHVAAPLVSGFASGGLFLLPFGIVYLLMAEGLRRGWRWLAYLTFVLMMFGAIAAYAMAGPGGAVPEFIYIGIVLANLACAVSLFVALW